MLMNKKLDVERSFRILHGLNKFYFHKYKQRMNGDYSRGFKDKDYYDTINDERYENLFIDVLMYVGLVDINSDSYPYYTNPNSNRVKSYRPVTKRDSYIKPPSICIPLYYKSKTGYETFGRLEINNYDVLKKGHKGYIKVNVMRWYREDKKEKALYNRLVKYIMGDTIFSSNRRNDRYLMNMSRVTKLLDEGVPLFLKYRTWKKGEAL